MTTVRKNLMDNIKRVSLAQTSHVDEALFQAGSADDMKDEGSYGEQSAEEKKSEPPKALQQPQATDAQQLNQPLIGDSKVGESLGQSENQLELGNNKTANQSALEQIDYGPEGPPKPSTETNALLITGATHARELLSSQVPLYACLKLLHQAYVQNVTDYQKLLAANVYYFVPVINVDGAALVEQHWLSEHKILNKRKNMNPMYMGSCGAENSGTDLNRNYGVDWSTLSAANYTDLCGDYWPGQQAFSEPESRALRDFVAQRKYEIKFIINCHTSGNQFVWPFNGRAPNDIEARTPGYLAIFQDIDKNAPFPYGTLKGNAHEVIGDQMGGDADDYMMATFGIPSVTAEMGFFGQYIQDWRCQSKAICHDIIRENMLWMEYISGHLGHIAAQLTIK